MGSSERAEREKAERRRQREELILSAAEKLFLEKGFAATTIGQIADACELTNAAIYLYYKNKDELILKVMTGISRNFAGLLSQASCEGAELNGAGRLRTLLEVYNHTYGEYLAYHRLDAEFNMLFCDSYPDSPLLGDYYAANRQVLDIVTDAVGAGIADGSLRADSGAEAAARLLLNAVNSYVEKISLRRELMESEQGIKLEDELKLYIKLIIGALETGACAPGESASEHAADSV